MKTVNGFLYVGERLTPSIAQFKAPISAAGHLDLGRMAVAGHSMGGLAAALTIEHDLRFKAGVIIDVHDGYVPTKVIGSTRTPVFILASGRQRWSENECRLWKNLQGPPLCC